MQFHPEVGTLLKRATQLALSGGANSVGVEHLLECNPDREPSPVAEREISFHPDVLKILSLTGELAGNDFSSTVRRGHLELALLRTTARLPSWSEFRPASPDGLVKLLHATALQALPGNVLELDGLVRGVYGVTSSASEAPLDAQQRVRFLAYARRCGNALHSLPMLVLLNFVMSPSGVGRWLRSNGLNEAILMKILEDSLNPVVPAQPREIPANAVDFASCLGHGVERFSNESLTTLTLAWLLRDHDELCGRDLLRALIAGSNQLETRNVHSLLHSLRPANKFVANLDTVTLRQRIGEPVFSAEAYRMIDAAFREAGPGRQVENLDLLIGLAECGQELLVREGITSDEIRGRWSEGF